MMKLSFTTLGCPEWSFEYLIEQAEKLGYSGIEIRGVNGVMRAEEIPEFFPENMEATKKLLREHNLEMVGFGTSANFHNEANAAKGIDESKKAIDVCATLGIPAIRVFGDALPDKEHAEETIALVGNSIAEVCRYAEGKGVDVLLEVHGDFNTIETVGGVIEACKEYKCFGILWDIEHSDRAYADNWQPFYQAVRPYIKHIHVKDYLRHEDGSFTLCLVGEGDIPIKDIITTLKEDGYDGYYSLEWEKKWVPELPDPEVAFPAYYEFMKQFEK